MDLQYILGQYPSDSNSSNVNGTGSQFFSDDGTKDFMHKFPWLSIPYLIVVVLGTFFGTIGNVLVICSVFINKVGQRCHNYILLIILYGLLGKTAKS